HLPAPGELLSPALPLFFPESKPAKHGSYFSLNSISVARSELVLQAVETVRDLGILRPGMVKLRHAPSKVLHLLLHGTQFGEDGHAFGKNRAARQREPILREVAGRDSS